MNYPGRIIKVGESDASVVRAIAAELQRRGYPSASPAGTFDRALKSLVALFQSQHADAAGRPLLADGEVGPLTWGALFGAAPTVPTSSSLGTAALGMAITQLGVREVPIGSNRGPMVDQYLASTNTPPGNFWCMAFVFWCFREAAANNGMTNHFPKKAGVLRAWNQVRNQQPQRIVTKANALADPSLVKPGCVFILDHGGGLGHTGFVRQSLAGALRTVEGNADPTGGRNGVGVFELNHRKVTDPRLKGFIDFT